MYTGYPELTNATENNREQPMQMMSMSDNWELYLFGNNFSHQENMSL